jgi:hypothetical protein
MPRAGGEKILRTASRKSQTAATGECTRRSYGNASFIFAGQPIAIPVRVSEPSGRPRVHIRRWNDRTSFAAANGNKGSIVCMEPKVGNQSGKAADEARLRYHLTSLYALRPIPDDLLNLVRRIDERLQSTSGAD